MVCAAIDSVVLAVDARSACRLEHAAEKLAGWARVGVTFRYQLDFLGVVDGDLLYPPSSRITGAAGTFDGGIPHGVNGKNFAGGTSVWFAAG